MLGCAGVVLQDVQCVLCSFVNGTSVEWGVHLKRISVQCSRSVEPAASHREEVILSLLDISVCIIQKSSDSPAVPKA